MGKFLKNQFGILLSGFVFWFPIIVFVFVLVFIFDNLENIGRGILLLYLPESIVFPGFGILFGIILIYISGLVLKLTKVRRFFSKIPLLGLLFGEGKVITVERLVHLSPCLFLLSPSCPSYGWILSEENVKVSDRKDALTLINVFYPNVPTIVTGQVFPVRKDTVIKLGNSSKEIVDLLLYAFRSPPDIKYMPWDDESPEDFEKRAKSFGLGIK
jgi:uncharacterized membrane protein